MAPRYVEIVNYTSVSPAQPHVFVDANKRRIIHHAHFFLFCPILTELESGQQTLIKIPPVQYTVKICPVVTGLFGTNRRTDVRRATVVLPKIFLNAPKTVLGPSGDRLMP